MQPINIKEINNQNTSKLTLSSDSFNHMIDQDYLNSFGELLLTSC